MFKKFTNSSLLVSNKHSEVAGIKNKKINNLSVLGGKKGLALTFTGSNEALLVNDPTLKRYM